MKIAFIGGGNMASALIGGLFAGDDSNHTINVADPGPDVKERLQKQWPVNCFSRATDAITDMDAIVLAVKPQILPLVLEEIGSLIASEQLLISIVAGVPVEQIRCHTENDPAIIRTMPNTPALIGYGITALFAGPDCTSAQIRLAEQLMKAAGEVEWVDDEALLNVVTAVSGSGPAYFFYLIEAMRDAGTRQGLEKDLATRLAIQTALGAGAMAKTSEIDVSELRRRVTSKGGTTQAALDQFRAGGFEQLVDAAIEAATIRGQELALNEETK